MIDDSAVVRAFLADPLAAGGVEVIGTAADPLIAWRSLRRAGPT